MPCVYPDFYSTWSVGESGVAVKSQAAIYLVGAPWCHVCQSASSSCRQRFDLTTISYPQHHREDLPLAVITMAQHANDRASTHSIEKDLEKVDHIEVNNNKYANIGLTAEETDFYENFPEEKKKKMIRKIDFRLVPVLAVS